MGTRYLGKVRTGYQMIITAIIPYNYNLVLANMRRIMPAQMADELVGIQPMTGPVGDIFTRAPAYKK
jgi:hypothetical protein